MLNSWYIRYVRYSAVTEQETRKKRQKLVKASKYLRKFGLNKHAETKCKFPAVLISVTKQIKTDNFTRF